MYKYITLYTLALLLSLSAVAQPNWKATKAKVTFKIRNAGLNVNGSFDGLTGNLEFDPAAPEKARLSASVTAKTVDPGSGMGKKRAEMAPELVAEIEAEAALASV